MSATERPLERGGLTPAQHIREAEHLLSDLAFWRGRGPIPAVNIDGLAVEVDTRVGEKVAEHLVRRAWLHLGIAQALSNLPEVEAAECASPPRVGGSRDE